MSMKILLAVPVLVFAAGCAAADSSEIVTFTDEHGRACTAVVVNDQSDEGGPTGREAQSLDCEYPPAGKSPGPATSRPLPAGSGDE